MRMSLAMARPRATVDDYLALPDTIRAELICGTIYVNAAPRPKHQRVIGELHLILRHWFDTHDLGEVWLSPVDVYLPTGDICQPDLVCLFHERVDIVKEDAMHGVPSFLIEVLSPSNPERDRIVKMDRYARSGVPMYWIVDAIHDEVEIFRLQGDSYEPAGWFAAGSTLTCHALPDFRLPLADLFGS